jgi:hypothetical protein
MKKKVENNPMYPLCGARSKRTGKPCQKYPCKNGRCNLHGGKSTGPKTSEGRNRQILAVTRHGRYTKESIAERLMIKQLIKDSKNLLNSAE